MEQWWETNDSHYHYRDGNEWEEATRGWGRIKSRWGLDRSGVEGRTREKSRGWEKKGTGRKKLRDGDEASESKRGKLKLKKGGGGEEWRKWREEMGKRGEPGEEQGSGEGNKWHCLRP